MAANVAARIKKKSKYYLFEDVGIIPTDGIPWNDANHEYLSTRLLTQDDPVSEQTPVGFKGELYMPQRTLLAAMITLEKNPSLNIKHTTGIRYCQTQMGRISEKFSFGKTVVALALICSKHDQACMPSLQQRPITNITNYGIQLNFIPEITVQYQHFTQITVVAVSSSIISQWVNNIKQFTNLRYFVLENVHDLRNFEPIYRSGQISEYDLILVKVGQVTTSFKVAGESKNCGLKGDVIKSRPLIEALSYIFEGVPVARFIIDDYDTLKLSKLDCLLPALFTWIISATRRRKNCAITHIPKDPATIESFFRQNLTSNFSIANIAFDDVVNTVFSLRCAPSYIDSYINSTSITFRKCFVTGGLIAKILRDLQVPEEVVEMLNANAVKTAAQMLNIEAVTVGAIINQVVGASMNKLKKAIQTINHIEYVNKALSLKDPKYISSKKDPETIKILRNAIKEGSIKNIDDAIQNITCNATEMLKLLEESAKVDQDNYGKSLERMRSNIREQHCQCCMIPFDETDVKTKEPVYILSGCCQIIVCETCITLTHNKIRSFIKRCPNCATNINVASSIIRIGDEFDIKEALKNDHFIEDLKLEDLKLEDPKLEDPKLRALVQIINKEITVGSIRDIITDSYITKLLDGKRNIPWPAGKKFKLLVFTMFSESTQFIATSLTKYAIPFYALKGTRSQKDEIIRSFREDDVNVILVTAAKDCGGLDLPFISHIVYYHKVIDRNVEAQVAGRGQRIGREHNLEIVSIINESEA